MSADKLEQVADVRADDMRLRLTRVEYAALALGLGLGVLGDEWLRGSRVGVAAPLYATLLVAALVRVVWLAGVRPRKRNLWCGPLLLLAALVPWLRDEPTLVFASLGAAWTLLVLLVHAGTRGAIDRWAMVD